MTNFKVGDKVKDQYGNIGIVQHIRGGNEGYVYFDIGSGHWHKFKDLSLVTKDKPQKKTIIGVFQHKTTKEIIPELKREIGGYRAFLEDEKDYTFIKEIEVELPEEEPETLSKHIVPAGEGEFPETIEPKYVKEFISKILEMIEKAKISESATPLTDLQNNIKELAGERLL